MVRRFRYVKFGERMFMIKGMVVGKVFRLKYVGGVWNKMNIVRVRGYLVWGEVWEVDRGLMI